MNQIDVAIGIVCRDGQVLICRRRQQDHLGGYWEFPGGKVEPGETVQQSLARELREELDIEAEPITELRTIEYKYPDRRVRLFPRLCAHTRGEPKPLGCEQALWIDPAALRDYRFPPANAQLIDELTHYFTNIPPVGRPA